MNDSHGTVIGVVEHGRLHVTNPDVAPPPAPDGAERARRQARLAILKRLADESIDINVLEAVTGRGRTDLNRHNPDYPRETVKFSQLPIAWRKTAAERIDDALTQLQEDYDRNVQLNLKWVAWQLSDATLTMRMAWTEEKRRRLEADAKEKAERDAEAAAEAALTVEQRRQRAIDQVLDTRLLDPQARAQAGRGELVELREVREGSTIYQEPVYAAPLPDRTVMGGAVAREAARLSHLGALSATIVAALTGIDVDEAQAWEDMTGATLDWATLPAEWTGDFFQVRITRAIQVLKDAAAEDPATVDPWAVSLRDVLLALGYDTYDGGQDDQEDDTEAGTSTGTGTGAVQETGQQEQQEEETRGKRRRWPWQH
ncbi:hypothetical protein [Actinomyces glycerinitolerans]|uniref:Uncharacterized protein n=1 Tax=Actinomyces glycerinitolerans TaxID=1892869 RepID=A0A1M4RZ60_9ACTO|nr:hypothetical protein [Actinomyces glycerinitolerans]SHE25211.1 Hypothetical protein ACGLYG10_1427 [Actinomyces glycerinitolerans]